jgi:uncharacterized protein YdcH (DUF465 family)
MNITLRKANAVQNSINDVIKNIKIETTIDLNEFQDPNLVLTDANNKLFAADARRQKLLLALYNIRGLVGTANAASGIDVSLAKAAFIDKRISQLEEIATLKPHTDISVIQGKLEKIKNLKDEARSRIYGYGDTVSTTVVSQEQIDQAKAEILNLKKQKQKLNDEILELNIKTEIPLSDDTVALLQSEGLL